MRRRHSVRSRIAATYAVVFAVVLGVVASASYWFLAYTSQERVDEFLAESASAIAAALEFEHNAGAPDTLAVQNVVGAMKLPDVAVLISDRSGGISAASYEGLRFRRTQPRELADSLATLLRSNRELGSEPELFSTRVSGIDVRVFTLPYVLRTRRLHIRVAQVMSARSQMLADARWAFGVGLPILLVAMSLAAWSLAGRALAPIRAISQRAAEIGASNLGARLPVVNVHDELGGLTTVFNDLLGRLERAFQAQAQFAADASHELRTPVAIIHGECDHALSKEHRSREELRDALQVIHTESQRLRGIVDDLFFFTRSDAGEIVPRCTPLNLEDLTDDAARSLRTLAATHHVTISVHPIDSARISADEALLRRAIDNLLVNAVKYGGPHHDVGVWLRDLGDHWAVDVVDAGPGIPEPARERLFDRFFRATPSRDDPARDGAGLGLPIARWIARAHGGDLMLVASDEEGSTFRMVLPKARISATE